MWICFSEKQISGIINCQASSGTKGEMKVVDGQIPEEVLRLFSEQSFVQL